MTKLTRFMYEIRNDVSNFFKNISSIPKMASDNLCQNWIIYIGA